MVGGDQRFVWQSEYASGVRWLYDGSQHQIFSGYAYGPDRDVKNHEATNSRPETSQRLPYAPTTCQCRKLLTCRMYDDGIRTLCKDLENGPGGGRVWLIERQRAYWFQLVRTHDQKLNSTSFHSTTSHLRIPAAFGLGIRRNSRRYLSSMFNNKRTGSSYHM